MKSFLSLLMIVSLLSAFSYEESASQTSYLPPQPTVTEPQDEEMYVQRIPSLLKKTFLIQTNILTV